MASSKSGARQARNAKRAATEHFAVGRFALLGETLLLGVCLFVLALPVVTAPAAYAAGAAHLERHVAGRPDTLVSLWDDFRAALPGSWKWGLLLLGAGLLAGVNVLLAGSQQLPGSRLVLAVTVFLAAALTVLLLRACALWDHERARRATSRAAQSTSPSLWSTIWVQARTETAADWVGTGMLLLALAMSVLFMWMLPPLLFIIPGVLILAVVSVRFRYLRRQAD